MKAKKQEYFTKKSRRKWIVVGAVLLFLLIAGGGSLYIIYRTHPLITIKNAFQKNARSGCFSFVLNNGEDTLSGTALPDLKQRKFDLVAEKKSETVYIYQNTIFCVDQNTEAISAFQDISEIVEFTAKILEGEFDADSVLTRLRGRLVLGSGIDHFFNADLLADLLPEYLKKLARTEYLEHYFGYKIKKENQKKTYSFTPVLYEAVVDFVEMLRPAFWTNEKYELFRRKMLEEKKEELETIKIRIDFVIQNGYIICVSIQNGESTMDLTCSDFGKARPKMEEAALYYQKKKEQRG